MDRSSKDVTVAALSTEQQDAASQEFVAAKVQKPLDSVVRMKYVVGFLCRDQQDSFFGNFDQRRDIGHDKIGETLKLRFSSSFESCWF